MKKQTAQLRGDVLLVVEEEGNNLNITEGNMSPMEKVIVAQYLISSLSRLSKIDPITILEDLKTAYMEPNTEVETVKAKKGEE